MADELPKLLECFQREIVSHVDSGISGIRGDVSQLREEMDTRHREVLSHFDTIYARFDRLENEHQAIAVVVSRLETRTMSRAEFEREIEQLKGRLQHLEQRLNELERSSREN